MTEKNASAVPGVYLHLWHGRRRDVHGVMEQLDDWGSEGPVFGPLEYVQTTYATDIKFTPLDESYNGWLNIVDDLVYYAGVYYGDWTVTADPEVAKYVSGVTAFKTIDATPGRFVLRCGNVNGGETYYQEIPPAENDDGLHEVIEWVKDVNSASRYDSVAQVEAVLADMEIGPAEVLGDVFAVCEIESTSFSNGQPVNGIVAFVKAITPDSVKASST